MSFSHASSPLPWLSQNKNPFGRLVRIPLGLFFCGAFSVTLALRHSSVIFHWDWLPSFIFVHTSCLRPSRRAVLSSEGENTQGFFTLAWTWVYYIYEIPNTSVFDGLLTWLLTLRFSVLYFSGHLMMMCIPQSAYRPACSTHAGKSCCSFMSVRSYSMPTTSRAQGELTLVPWFIFLCWIYLRKD